MLHLTLAHGDGIPLYVQLEQQIRHLIAAGRLKPETEMPSVRALAEQLVINPNTVVRAYRELEVAGLLYKKRGSGTYVASGNTPYTDEECRRILGQRADALLVEGRNMGYDIDQLVRLLRERDKTFKQPKEKERR